MSVCVDESSTKEVEATLREEEKSEENSKMRKSWKGAPPSTSRGHSGRRMTTNGTVKEKGHKQSDEGRRSGRKKNRGEDERFSPAARSRGRPVGEHQKSER